MEPAGQARVARRLAAILAADVAGYSRLIEADEEGTLGQLGSNPMTVFPDCDCIIVSEVLFLIVWLMNR